QYLLPGGGDAERRAGDAQPRRHGAARGRADRGEGRAGQAGRGGAEGGREAAVAAGAAPQGAGGTREGGGRECAAEAVKSRRQVKKCGRFGTIETRPGPVALGGPERVTCLPPPNSRGRRGGGGPRVHWGVEPAIGRDREWKVRADPGRSALEEDAREISVKPS